jgi:hypothetical protein
MRISVNFHAATASITDFCSSQMQCPGTATFSLFSNNETRRLVPTVELAASCTPQHDWKIETIVGCYWLYTLRQGKQSLAYQPDGELINKADASTAHRS